MNEYMNQSYTAAGEVPETLGHYTAKTFGWMFLGLMVTFLVAITGYATGAIIYIFYLPYVFFILGIAEVATVIFLSARIQKMSVGMARAMFLLYAVLNGIVFSAYFLIYDMGTLVIVFGATSLFFGVMALIGTFTNADFSGIRPFLTAGLIFLIVFWLLASFMNLEGFVVAACYIGIFIFLVFTAYDTQKIKGYYHYYSGNPDMAAKASIFAALQLYLDFVNLFLYLLRLLGRSRK